ncbi:MAG: helix-turn-helix transcriptional regulator [Rhodospirillaceae bacterium]|jgi:transcriptional regulator with XRE-family HTH domain|nr:helix-turn-helix transcriptional regulator [Rhodospirillaceae bacterium]
MEHWSKRLWRALSWKGWSQRELARRAEIDEQKVYKYLQGKVDQPRGDTMLRLADCLGVTESWLRFDVGPAVIKIPVVGRVTSGESFIPIDNSPINSSSEEVDFSLDDADPIAIEVRGESMLPVYRPGDYLLCSRRRGIDIQQCLNRDCVVKTDQGEGFVKKLISGPADGSYTLVSYNAPAIEGVRLLWAAPIIWVKRA